MLTTQKTLRSSKLLLWKVALVGMKSGIAVYRPREPHAPAMGLSSRCYDGLHMIRAPKQFVCADCNEIVLHPANQKGFLRRPQGHRVQGFTPRSALLEIAVTLFVALCASGFLIGVGNV